MPNEAEFIKRGHVRQIFDNHIGGNPNNLEPHLQLGVECLLSYDELSSSVRTPSKHARMQTKTL